VTINAPDASTISVTTTSAEANDLTITQDASGFTVVEGNPSVTMTTGGACGPGAGPNTAECPATASRLTMSLGDGNDRARVQAPLNSTILGEGGDDTIDGGPGADSLFGDGPSESDPGAGADRLEGGAGGDALSGGRGADTLVGDTGADVLNGGSDGDALSGGDDPDTVSGGDGGDALSGGGGDDRLDGGPGDDTVGVAAPIVVGATLLPTEPGNDVLSGGPGNDAIDPGVGGAGDRDVLVGGDGQDGVSYGLRSTPVVTTKDGIANDGQVGEADNIGGDVERIDGGLANDSVGGGPGPDLLGGGPGADSVTGFGGDDRVAGGPGADTLRGGPGADQLVGGPDRDVASYVGEPRVTVRLDRGTARTARRGDRDRLAEVEDVRGGGQGDTLTGSGGRNRIDGTAGADYVDGGHGVDRLAGGSSADLVAARDGVRDEPVSCGPGQDLAIIDRKDRVVRRGANRCEQVDDGSRTKPRPGWVYVHPQRCAGSREADLGLPAMHRLVPLRYAILLASGFRRRPAPMLDTSDCTVRVIATPGQGRRASADVSGGAVAVDQSSGRSVATTLTVKRPTCGAGGRRLAAGARQSRARVNTHRRPGRWRVRGKFSLGASFGTDWTTIEGCSGTTTVVHRGRVRVFDRAKRRTVTVRAGHRYVARAGKRP
jgi:Ca2+-binding RTX toxin-like protein